MTFYSTYLTYGGSSVRVQSLSRSRAFRERFSIPEKAHYIAVKCCRDGVDGWWTYITEAVYYDNAGKCVFPENQPDSMNIIVEPGPILVEEENGRSERWKVAEGAT